MEIKLTEKEELARKRVCLALDTPTVPQALDLAAELSDLVGSFKVGKTLHTAAGNDGVPIVREIYKRRGEVFLDLKLKDTPDQVYGAAKACVVPGVYMFNLHLDGGEAMCREALRAAKESATAQGIPVPKVIGVTVLTSLNDKDLEVQGIPESYKAHVLRMTGLAREWGLDGVVCAANVAGEMEKQFGQWLYVTPGIKYAGVQNVGQKQLDTPDGAVQACSSSILVVGSAITKAKDRRATAYEILQVMAKHL